MSSDVSEEYNNARRRLHEAQGQQAYHLELFGDAVAEHEGYRDLNGIDALRFYLMQKHDWTPAVVRSLSYEDIYFALTLELAGWTVGARFRKPATRK